MSRRQCTIVHIHAVSFLLLAAAAPARAACPCYDLNSQYNSYNCGVAAANGTNPTVAEWQPIFALICQGPTVWGNAGPSVSKIGQGCNMPMPPTSVDASFPIELLKGIAMQESGWRQFCVPSAPADEVGGASRTIISFDCGYGIGQVTSGMHKGENPGFDRAKVAGDPTYNMATGTQILAQKWIATNCVGDNQPKIVEDWYTATWAYNGLAYSNNPSNPNLDANRGVYDPNVGGSYAYQERVWGWIEHPPGASYWPSVPLAYPNRANVGGGGSPPNLPEPDCASPTDCTNKRSVHTTACGPTAMPDMAMSVVDQGAPADLAAPVGDGAGGRRDGAPTGGDGAAMSGDGAAMSGDGGGGGSTGGCGCALGARSSSPPLLVLLLALALVRRRR
jgi:MYXO-CTERM domain-containing protein